MSSKTIANIVTVSNDQMVAADLCWEKNTKICTLVFKLPLAIKFTNLSSTDTAYMVQLLT